VPCMPDWRCVRGRVPSGSRLTADSTRNTALRCAVHCLACAGRAACANTIHPPLNAYWGMV